jgi:hypothetical protein
MSGKCRRKCRIINALCLALLLESVAFDIDNVLSFARWVYLRNFSRLGIQMPIV